MGKRGEKLDTLSEWTNGVNPELEISKQNKKYPKKSPYMYPSCSVNQM
jgi:hypothetical protein